MRPWHGDVDEKTRSDVDSDPEELRAEAQRLTAAAERAEAEREERERQAEAEQQEREEMHRYLVAVEQRRRARDMAAEARVQAAIVFEAAVQPVATARSRQSEGKQFIFDVGEAVHSLVAADAPMAEIMAALALANEDDAKKLLELLAQRRAAAEAVLQSATEKLKWATNEEKVAYEELGRLGPAALEGVTRPEGVPDPAEPPPRYSERGLELFDLASRQRVYAAHGLSPR